MKQSIRDNLVYLGVGLAIAAGFVLYIFHTERVTGTIRPMPGPILWGILSTPGIVALVLAQFWSYRHRRMLWAIVTVVVSMNLSAVIAAYYRHWNPPVIIWSLITGVLMIPVFVVAEKLLANR